MWELEDFTQIRRWYVIHLLLCITFFFSGLIINAVQFILYISLRPFSVKWFRIINYYLMYSLMAQILFLAEWWSGSDVRVYTSDESFNKWGKEHALIVMNHSYEVDWLMGWIVADRANVLGSAKVFVKNMIKYVPTIGWAWTFSDVIFLHRNWQEDKSIMEKQVHEFFDYPYPVWMLLFCEGTRFTPAKHAASLEFAEKRGMKGLKHLLLPRTRGFVQCVQSMKGQFPAIYDVTVTFNLHDGAEPTLVNMLRGQKVIGELYVRRIPLEQVPEGEKEAAEYLHELYRSKDELLDSYTNTGSFTKQNKLPEHMMRAPPRRYFSLVNIAVWASLVSYLIGLFYYTMLTSGSWVANSVAVGVAILAYFGLYKMIGLTRIDKGSHYGSAGSKSE